MSNEHVITGTMRDLAIAAGDKACENPPIRAWCHEERRWVRAEVQYRNGALRVYAACEHRTAGANVA